MKKGLLIIVTAACSIAAMAQDAPAYMVKNLGANINATEVSTSGGSIQVMHEAGEQNRVEVYIRGNNDKQLSKEEIEQRLKQDYELTIETSGNKLVAKAKRRSNDNNWKNGLSISFKIYVSEKTDNKLATSGGSITLGGLNGNQDFATSGGSLNLVKLGGNLEGATSGGSISISGSKASGKLTTSGGSISASECGGDLKLTTSGGSIKLNKLNGNFEVATSGGSVNGDDISGELEAATSGGSMHLNNMKCTLDAATSGGSIHVQMTALGKYVKLSNSAGNIELSLPAAKGYDLDLKGNKVSVPNLSNFSGDVSGEAIKGKLNGGGIPVTAKSIGGKITLAIQ